MDRTQLCARVGGRWAGVRVTFACVCLMFATGIGARERRTCIACISRPGLAFIKELISKSSSSLSVFARCGGKQIFLPGVVGILWLRVKHYWYVEARCGNGRALFSMFVDDPVAASTPCLLGLCTIVYALASAFAMPTAKLNTHRYATSLFDMSGRAQRSWRMTDAIGHLRNIANAVGNHNAPYNDTSHCVGFGQSYRDVASHLLNEYQ